jgi:hypothetical protein
MKKLLLIVVMGLVVCAVAVNFLLSATPSVRLDPSVKALGTDSPVHLEVSSPHGVRRVTGWVEQGGKRHQVFQKTDVARRLSLFRSTEPDRRLEFRAGRNQAPELKDGPAKLIVEAVANDFAGRTATASAAVQVNTTPPTVSADGFQHYINQGSTRAVQNW